MRHQLDVRLSDTRSAFPRVVSRLHSLSLTVERLKLDGGRCQLVVETSSSAERVVTVLERLVDVLEVRARATPPTRAAVVRQTSSRSTTTHPWGAPTRLTPAER